MKLSKLNPTRRLLICKADLNEAKEQNKKMYEALKEATDLLSLLMSYSKIRPIKGVSYPEGTHEKVIEKTDKFLYYKLRPLLNDLKS